MFHAAFFALAFAHNILLIWRHSGSFKLKIVEINPVYYEFILIPAFFLLFIGIVVRIDPGEMLTIISLIGFVFLEILYEYIWRVDNLKELKFRIPYLIFYYPLHVGFLYFIFQWNTFLGFILLILTVVQLGMNSVHMRRSYLSV